jgi:N-acetyl sugar amidotransferase
MTDLKPAQERTIDLGKPKYGLPKEVIFCKRCVISNQRPNSTIEHKNHSGVKKQTINFVDGVCDACRFAERKASIDWEERERELKDLCDQHRSYGRHYDCIVPGSGGKDSFYAAHVLKTKYGMSPLTVTWAPHIYTDIGWKNWVRWLYAGFDNFLMTPNPRVHRLLTRLALENLFHPFQPFVLGQKNLAPRMAHRYGIKLVFYGESEAEYGNPIADTEKAERDPSYYSSKALNIFLGGASLHELTVKHGLTMVDIHPYLPAEQPADVRYLGYYLKWNPQNCFYYANQHGGFEPAPERTPGTYSRYNSIDDKIDDLHYWTTYIKFGIGRATYDAAQEIRNEDITREEGVSLVRRYDGEYPTRFEEEVFEYLSVPGFEPMTREYLMGLAEKFKSPHIWDGDKLRHLVS